MALGLTSIVATPAQGLSPTYTSVTITSSSFFEDNAKASFGNSVTTPDMSIYSDGTNAILSASVKQYFTSTYGASGALTNVQQSDFVFDLSATKNWAGGGGAIASQADILISARTYTADAAQTISKAATLAISGAPTAGSGMTITAPYALWVQAGLSQFDGSVTLGGNVFFTGTYLAMTLNKPIYFDTGGKNGIKLNTSQTPDAVSIGLDGSGSYSRNIFIEEIQDWGYDRAIASPTNPTLSIWSANQSQTERIYLYHDQTDAVVASGAGSVKLSPVTTVNINGGLVQKITTVNAATYDLLVTDLIVHVTYTATGAVTSLTLPSAQAVAGRLIMIKDAGGNAGVNNITIDTEGSETIDGQATLGIDANYESFTLYSDGSNWFKI